MTRVIIHVKNRPYFFWSEAMNNAFHIKNRVTIRPCTKAIHYEVWWERKPMLNNFMGLKVFAILFQINNTKGSLILKVMRASMMESINSLLRMYKPKWFQTKTKILPFLVKMLCKMLQTNKHITTLCLICFVLIWRMICFCCFKLFFRASLFCALIKKNECA